MTGFSWYYLAHTQYRWIELIQISDLVGAYGVSFLVALVSGCVAEMLPAKFVTRLGLLPAAAGTGGPRTAATFRVTIRAASCPARFWAVLPVGRLPASVGGF